MTIGADEGRAVWAFAEHEHRDLAHGINRIHDVACLVGELATPDLSARVLDVLHWLDAILGPHIAWEDGWLFPEIDARTGTTTTLAARFEHRQIREVTARLRADHERLDRRGDPGDKNPETRFDLFRLEALIRDHLEHEERFLIPLLDEGPRPVQGAGMTSARRAPD